MCTSRTTVGYIRVLTSTTCTACIYIKSRPEEHSTWLCDRQQRRETANIRCSQLLPSCWSRLARLQPCPLRLFVLSCGTHYLDSLPTYLSKCAVFRAPSEGKKATREPGVRCYELLARPVARPGSSEAATCETLHTKEPAPSVCTLHRQAFVAADRHMTASVLTPESQRLASPLAELRTAAPPSSLDFSLLLIYSFGITVDIFIQ